MEFKKYVPTLEAFIAESKLATPDLTTQLYMEGDITLEQYEQYFNNALNEGLTLDDVTGFISKKVDQFKEWTINFLVKVAIAILPYLKAIGKFIGKINSLISLILKKIGEFKDKHPFLFKVLVCMTILIVLSVIFAQGAQAQTPPGGGPVNINSDEIKHGIKLQGVNADNINVLLGYIQTYLPATDKDVLATLTDAKDGTLDVSTFQHYQECVKAALESFNGAANNLVTGEKGQFSSEQIQQFMDIGKQYQEYVETGFDHIVKSAGDVGTLAGRMAGKTLKSVDLIPNM